MKKIYLTLVLLAIVFSGCEKDDICDANTPTTPRIIIEFYSASNPALLKNVVNLKVKGVGMDEEVILDETPTGDPLYVSNLNKIAVPLKTLEDKTQLVLIYNSLDPTLIRQDTIEFNYTRATEYVSRACGFRTKFTMTPISGAVEPVIINNGGPKNWIDSFELLQTNINDENEVHLKILF